MLRQSAIAPLSPAAFACVVIPKRALGFGFTSLLQSGAGNGRVEDCRIESQPNVLVWNLEAIGRQDVCTVQG